MFLIRLKIKHFKMIINSLEKVVVRAFLLYFCVLFKLYSKILWQNLDY